MHNPYFWGVADDKVTAGLNFSPIYFSAAVKRAMKPVIFMYHDAISMFLGSKNVLNLVHLWVCL